MTHFRRQDLDDIAAEEAAAIKAQQEEEERLEREVREAEERAQREREEAERKGALLPTGNEPFSDQDYSYDGQCYDAWSWSLARSQGHKGRP